MHVTGLFIYPVKSLRGLSIATAALDDLGLVGDRRFMVVDETGRFVTQRTVPRMALIETALSSEWLILSTAGSNRIQIPRTSDPAAPLIAVSIWSSAGLRAEDCGEDVADWLESFLAVKCRLVRIGRAFDRPLNKPDKSRRGDVLAFADGYPLLAISEASLADLNDRIIARGEQPVPMDRFRPNLVIGECAAFNEDSWTRVRIGETVLRAGGPCARCIVTTTDQLTAVRGKEPLRTLATFRRDALDPSDVNFGQNLIHESKSGQLRVGASIELLS